MPRGSSAADGDVPGPQADRQEPGTVAAAGTQPLGRDQAEQIARLLKVVSDPTRLQLLSLIQASPTGEASVQDLTAPLGLRQPTVSHHLKVMVEAGLLAKRKTGTWSWYSIVPERLAAIADLLR